MIEQLAEHGVSADDLVPSLITTHTVPNPSYDPSATPDSLSLPTSELDELKLEADRIRAEDNLEKQAETSSQAPSRSSLEDAWATKDISSSYEASTIDGSSIFKAFNPFGNANDDSLTPTAPWASSSNSGNLEDQNHLPQFATRPSHLSQADDDEEGDLGDALSTPKARPTNRVPIEPDPSTSASKQDDPLDPPNLIAPLPHTLPGVSTTLTAADETITLDIRWTVLCDLFLAVIADSVYDARSRVMIGRCAYKLNLSWMDVVRFERRLTEALEVQEGISKEDHTDVIEAHHKKSRNKRLMMVGAATIGGGLVIGLSAGLLAPVIGAGLAAGFTTIGIGGTSGFLAGAGGAAVITTAGTVTGMNIAGTGMGKRTQSVKTFEILPLHNNRRVNVFLICPGASHICLSVSVLFSMRRPL